VSGDCKRESGTEHAAVLGVALSALKARTSGPKIRVVSLASDSESRRGSAMVQLTLKHRLPTSSSIYPYLSNLPFMNLYVGDDDITGDKDYKHVFKHLRNLLIRQHGIVIGGFHLTPDVLKQHLRSWGLFSEHIHSIFNPEDLQDVKLAFNLLSDIWSLPREAPPPMQDLAFNTPGRLFGC
jgi:hypothetical protein